MLQSPSLGQAGLGLDQVHNPSWPTRHMIFEEPMAPHRGWVYIPLAHGYRAESRMAQTWVTCWGFPGWRSGLQSWGVKAVSPRRAGHPDWLIGFAELGREDCLSTAC